MLLWPCTVTNIHLGAHVMFMSTLTPGAPLSLYMMAVVEIISTSVAVSPPWRVPPLLVCSSSTFISHTTFPGDADSISTWSQYERLVMFTSVQTGLVCISMCGSSRRNAEFNRHLPYLKPDQIQDYPPPLSWSVLVNLATTKPLLLLQIPKHSKGQVHSWRVFERLPVNVIQNKSIIILIGKYIFGVLRLKMPLATGEKNCR